ncbi:MAG: 2,4-dihydroxyhept-2-ene-1,7-dioic acid aldolase [Alphaproteobacteria bacterium]|nr:MAG: 2,4-dihydroxyhept-2-ene-1,7-dioic acid aldolase [Alphaproteobacteria bacterium]
MRPNRLWDIWAAGRAASNCWLNIPSPYVAELIAHQGWDSITIDLQHGMIGMKDAYAMLTAISTTDCVPLVRVPWNEPASIMQALDAGAYGIIAPMINSREECEAFVGACRYAPDGYRSVGPNRAVLYGGSDYLDKANRTVLTIAMIETVEALAALEEICTTPGLDAVLVGPSDLGLSMGREAKSNQTDPEVVKAIDHILEIAKGAGRKTAIFNSNVDYAKQMAAKGFDLVTVASDTGMIKSGAGLVREMRG